MLGSVMTERLPIWKSRSMSIGVKLGALAWARDNAHACHLISRGEANLYTSPPVENAVTPRLLGRGR